MRGAARTYTVTLSTQPTGPVTVRPAVPNNRDVTVSLRSLSFTTSDWDRPKSVTVTAAVDADGLDDTATVTHTVSGADYGSNHVTARDLPVAITDLVETESIALSVSPDSVPEGSSARTVRVTAELDGAPRDVATQVTVQVTGDTADATDFTAFPAAFVISIPPNRTQGTNTFRLSPIQDSIDEGIGETLVVSGSSTILAVTPATITIEDDDGVGFTLSRNSLTVTEDGSANLYDEAGDPADGAGDGTDDGDRQFGRDGRSAEPGLHGSELERRAGGHGQGGRRPGRGRRDGDRDPHGVRCRL